MISNYCTEYRTEMYRIDYSNIICRLVYFRIGYSGISYSDNYRNAIYESG